MGTNKNVVVSFSIAILLLLSLLLLLTYNSKCNQSHNTAGFAMQSSQNSYNIGNYSNTPEPFYIEKFSEAEPCAHQLTEAQEDSLNGKLKWEKIKLCDKWKRMGICGSKYESACDEITKVSPNAENTESAKPQIKKQKSTPQENKSNTGSAGSGYKSTINKGVGNFNKYSPFTDYNEGMNVEEGFDNYNEGMTVERMADVASIQTANEVSPQWSARANQQTQNTPMMSSQGQGPAGSFNGNSSFQSVSNMGGMGGGFDQQGMQSCFPRDRLTADDLLPKDAADSKWAQINPSGGGNIGDQNYLTAGYHVGVNTVGQSLRNANLQLRSEIPNPQDAVGPWMISTIEPDLRQNTLEIGSSISY